MKEILVALLALVLGFVTAIPIGATQIEIAKRSMGRQLKAALMVVAGSVASDMLYGFLALYGLAPFLQRKMILAGFEAVSVLLLWLLGFLTLRQSQHTRAITANNVMLSGKRFSFLTGFSLAATNPMIVFWWLLGMHFLIDLRLVNTTGNFASLIFLLFGGAGIASYLTLLAGTLYKVNRFITDGAMQIVYIILGNCLFLFSAYFFVRFIETVS